MDKITEDKIEKYLSITKKALDSVIINSKSERSLQGKGEEILDMAKRYFDDAKYYYEKKQDIVTAFAAVNYAHGWLDTGARIGLLSVKKNKELFTVD